MKQSSPKPQLVPDPDSQLVLVRISAPGEPTNGARMAIRVGNDSLEYLAKRPAPRPTERRRRHAPPLLSIPPGAVSEAAAAAFVGVPLSSFRSLVRRGCMPKPRKLGARRRIYLMAELEAALRELPRPGEEPRALPGSSSGATDDPFDDWK